MSSWIKYVQKMTGKIAPTQGLDGGGVGEGLHQDNLILRDVLGMDLNTPQEPILGGEFK